MKSLAVGGNQGGKRRWKVLGMGVLFLVVLSMLGPLIFLLGIYSGFRSSPPTDTGFITDEPRIISEFTDQINVEKIALGTTYIKDSSLPRDDSPVNVKEEKNDAVANDQLKGGEENLQSLPSRETVDVKNEEEKQGEGRMTSESRNSTAKEMASEDRNMTAKEMASEDRNLTAKEMGNQCETRFGSYCLWREENKEIMKDFTVKRMKDQLFVARAYYPSVAKHPVHEKLSAEVKQNIQEYERILSECTTDNDLPPQIRAKIDRMSAVIHRAKSLVSDCGNVDKKLRQILDLTEDEANFHTKQSAFLHHLTVQTKPKSHHCLSMKLTVEYFNPQNHSSILDRSQPTAETHSFTQHYVIFSNNVLATSVVVNSTVMHAMDSGNLMIHILTDRQNYFSIKLWFARHKYKDAVVEVLNIEEMKLPYNDTSFALSSFLPLEFRVSLAYRTEYLSISPPAFYLLPQLFPSLKRVIVLDDDVVVHKDLSDLWNLDMEGKVNGCQQQCSVQLTHLSNYLSGKTFDRNFCVWMSGLNVIDLAKWRELGVSDTFWKLSKEDSLGNNDPQIATLMASVLAFEKLVYPLNDTWTHSGLGHDYDIDSYSIRRSGVLHYNGNMKPWLELGIPKYKRYWRQFMNRDEQFLGECNVNT